MDRVLAEFIIGVKNIRMHACWQPARGYKAIGDLQLYLRGITDTVVIVLLLVNSVTQFVPLTLFCTILYYVVSLTVASNSTSIWYKRSCHFLQHSPARHAPGGLGRSQGPPGGCFAAFPPLLAVRRDSASPPRGSQVPRPPVRRYGLGKSPGLRGDISRRCRL